MEVEVAVLGSPSLIVLMPTVDVKQHLKKKKKKIRAQEPCECRGGRPGLSVPNSLHGHYGRKATFEEEEEEEAEVKSDLSLWGSNPRRPALLTRPLGQKAVLDTSIITTTS